MCYVGRLKWSMYLVNARLVCSQNRCKNLANTRLDLRNAANCLQIEGRWVLPGDPYHWGGRNTEHETMYIYIYIHMHIHMHIHTHIHTYIHTHTCMHAYIHTQAKLSFLDRTLVRLCCLLKARSAALREECRPSLSIRYWTVRAYATVGHDSYEGGAFGNTFGCQESSDCK